MMSRRILKATALAVLAAGLATASAAQMVMIHGKLEDGAGKPIAGYPVVLERKDGAQASLGANIGNIGFTSETGEFTVAVDQAGEYSAILPTLGDGAASTFQIGAEALQIDTLKAPGTDIGTIQLPTR